MTQPTVCAVMLANGRPDMVARAVASFRAQTYERKQLLIFNSGAPGSFSEYETAEDREWSGVTVIGASHAGSIGYLRNFANGVTQFANIGIEPDILIHWDSDDWSHLNRIAEQVALLQASGAECVGYREMLFWKTEEMQFDPAFGDGGFGAVTEDKDSISVECGPLVPVPDEAWLYSAAAPNYCLGTSMCYWRETWERHPFADRDHGCDDLHWINERVRMVGVSATPEPYDGFWGRYSVPVQPEDVGAYPRMIASIHGGNTCAAIDPQSRDWRRAPEWDGYCRERMAL